MAARRRRPLRKSAFLRRRRFHSSKLGPLHCKRCLRDIRLLGRMQRRHRRSGIGPRREGVGSAARREEKGTSACFRIADAMFARRVDVSAIRFRRRPLKAVRGFRAPIRTSAIALYGPWTVLAARAERLGRGARSVPTSAYAGARLWSWVRRRTRSFGGNDGVIGKPREPVATGAVV